MKQIWTIFLFKFKMGHKAVETTCNISSFHPGTAKEHTLQWWFKKFCKGDESLEDGEHCDWLLEVNNNQLRGSLKLILLKQHKKLPKNSVSTILLSFSIWSKLEKWKSSISRCLMNWLQKKNHHFEVLSSLILCNSKPFLNWIVMCDEKWISYSNGKQPAQWLDWKEAPKHFPKPNLVMVTVWWSACCLSDPLQLSESQRNYYIWEVCSANRWDALKTVMPEAGIGQQTGPSSPLQHPTAHCITNASKVEQIELWGFASSAIFTWPLANWLQLLQASRQTFCRENASTTSRRQKMLSKSLLNLKARIFMLQE